MSTSKMMNGSLSEQANVKKKSKMPGVKITQYTEDIPPGCSTPDFDRKPIPLTIQEGKTATFKAIICGEPKAQVTWSRNKGDMNDGSKYKITYDKIMDEHMLQVISVTGEDADTYKCSASNLYGEALCFANLIVIEIGFKKKAKPKAQEAAHEDPTEFRKLLKKRSPKEEPSRQQKALDSKVWEVLLSADKKDYERICIEYGITDFRGMLKKLNQLKKEREEEQSKFVEAISNLKHIQVTNEGSAQFEIEMQLKDENSRILLYKDGQLIPYSEDMEMKHNLRKVGKKYIFSIRDLLPEDAGLYQVDVEEVNVFSTDLPSKFIPINFTSPMKEVHCKEREDAFFEVTLSHPLPKLVWMYKNQTLEAGDKYRFTVSEDGLTHRLIIKDVMPVDKGIYSVAAGIRSSSAWLMVEIEESDDPASRAKRKPRKVTDVGENQEQDQQGKGQNRAKKGTLNRESGIQNYDGLGQDQVIVNGFDDGFGKDTLNGYQGSNSESSLEDSTSGQKVIGTLGGDKKGIRTNLEGSKENLTGLHDLKGGKGSCGHSDVVSSSAGDSQYGHDGILCDANESHGRNVNLGYDGLGLSLSEKVGQEEKYGATEGQGDERKEQSGLLNQKAGLGNNSGDNGNKELSGLLNQKAGLGNKSGNDGNKELSGLLNQKAGLGNKSGNDGNKDVSGLLNEKAGLVNNSGGEHGRIADGYGENLSENKSLSEGEKRSPIILEKSSVTDSDANRKGISESLKGKSGDVNGQLQKDLGAGKDIVGPSTQSLGYDNSAKSGLGRNCIESSPNVTGLTEDQNRKNKRSGRKLLVEESPSDLGAHFVSGLMDVQARKGHSAELVCKLSSDQTEGMWFKDGVKLQSRDGLAIYNDGCNHKLILSNVQDSDAGKYRFEADGHKSESCVVVEDPPEIDADEMEKLSKQPVVVKAGQNAVIKVPFQGRAPMKASWYKDGDELAEDHRMHIEKGPNHSRLLIGKCQRKDSGDIKLKLKNDSGTAEVATKLIVLDKPLSPQGPVEVLESSASCIQIKWRPPKDDGGQPINSYTVERQQVGRNTWVKVGEVPGSTTTYTSDKVDHGKKYCFRIRAVNSEGVSDFLETEDITAGKKAFPGPPAPPKIVSASSKAIALSWGAPHNTGGSRIAGYAVEKRKKGSNLWTSVSNEPLKEKKCVITDIVEGSQYEFRVAAVNESGMGEFSVPSNYVIARDPMRPPSKVKDLKVTGSSYSSLSLSWAKPDVDEGDEAKGYFVEVKPANSITWLSCNSAPVSLTSYTIKGLKSMEMYFVRVTPVNDGGRGEPQELDNYVIAMPPPVRPHFLQDASFKSFMVVKEGSTIRVNIHFEGSPTPEVIWMKNNVPITKRATITNTDGLSQLLIPTSDRTDSGIYSIMIKNCFGQESMSLEIRVTDEPKPPGLVTMEEKVPGTVTVFWEPSPDEKYDNRLHYMVMKRDSFKLSWQTMADHIFNNKITATSIICGRQYYFRVYAKNDMGLSEPSESPAWSINKEKDKFTVKFPHYKQNDQRQAPRFSVGLKTHYVPLGYQCNMSCAVMGNPAPRVTWYRDNVSIMKNADYQTSNICGVCSLIITGVRPKDSGEYMAIAENSLGKAICTTRLIVVE
ncbi:immunoglobulin-like and fibronectin type III domain-containing protein 1 isoform X1 [Polypterus senegalus]|uniref:immunoglobulin-like and fibronectin type III domain-containing protein 1 isoform X1 n=1 Tax=Polypterus senegalus TaxID=55291 RepID=UPI001963A380|nr:immunoglobulin-like and fibronectin type III domain-containing protein 1 isoform X1 [Polypterus senegalus]